MSIVSVGSVYVRYSQEASVSSTAFTPLLFVLLNSSPISDNFLFAAWAFDDWSTPCLDQCQRTSVAETNTTQLSYHCYLFFIQWLLLQCHGLQMIWALLPPVSWWYDEHRRGGDISPSSRTLKIQWIKGMCKHCKKHFQAEIELQEYRSVLTAACIKECYLVTGVSLESLKAAQSNSSAVGTNHGCVTQDA